jgi:uncharacterized lipoprotein YajG
MKINCSLLMAAVVALCAGCATNSKLTRYPRNSLVIQNRTPYEITVSRVGTPCVISLVEGDVYPIRYVAAHSTLELADFRKLPERISLRFTAEKVATTNGTSQRVFVGSRDRLVDMKGGPAKVIVLRKFWDF